MLCYLRVRYITRVMGVVTADRVARYLAKVEDAETTLEEMVARMTGAMVGADGEPEYQGLPAICAAWDVPYGRVMAWLMADEARYAVYSRALQVQAKALVSEAVPIADGVLTKDDVAAAKLRVDTRFRVAEFHDSAVYGKKDGGGSGITVVVRRASPASDSGAAQDAVAVTGPGGGGVSVSPDGRTLTVL